MGHDLLGYAFEILAGEEEMRIGGFLDDDESASGTDAAPLLGRIEDYRPSADDVLIAAIGRPSMRRTIIESLEQRGAQFTSLIHPAAHVATTAQIHPGTGIGPCAFVGDRSVVGPHAYLNHHTAVGHDAVISPYSVVSPFASVSGGAHLEEAVFVGTHALVGPECRIGSHSTVSAGAIVLSDLPENTFAAPPQVQLSQKPPGTRDTE
jgi:sugar O-acyltransferase (sialic acid O-acetyltransferase NeuD family)